MLDLPEGNEMVRLQHVDLDNAALRAELVTVYEMLDSIPDSAWEKAPEAKMLKVLRDSSEADKREMAQSKMDQLVHRIDMLEAIKRMSEEKIAALRKLIRQLFDHNTKLRQENLCLKNGNNSPPN